jgi:hypothetical protein
MSNVIEFPIKEKSKTIPDGMVSLNWRVEPQDDGTYTAMVVIEGIKFVDEAIATAERMCATIDADLDASEKEDV